MTLVQKLQIERAELSNKLSADRYFEVRANDPHAEKRLVEAKALRDQLVTANERLV